ncbi:MAG: Panacea domain-containing protein [Candidatus Gastranaerophilaceae bacterium]
MSNIKFNFNKQKAIETILYLANKDGLITKMRLLKFVFFADLYHVNKYGRPILGDSYFAMKNGPVLSKLYDMLKHSTTDYLVKDNNLIESCREFNPEYFSKSDIDALDYAFVQYSQYETMQLSELTHSHKTWLRAVRREPKSKNAKICWEDFFDNENNEDIPYLQEVSERMII